MGESEQADGNEAYEQALEQNGRGYYVLRLYVTGITPRSTQAINNIQQVCAQHLAGQFELEVIDIYQRPELAQEAQIVAAPTLIKQLPLPLRRLVGDLSNEERVLAGLSLVQKAET